MNQPTHDYGHSHAHSPDWAARMHRLDDPMRLETSLSEADLARLLALGGDESILDLGSGTGFYTDRMARLTKGAVYALEIVPEMLQHHRERGLPGNVRSMRGDMMALMPGAVTQGHTPAGLARSSVDLAVTIATWHEIRGRLDVPGLAQMVRHGGRFIVIDWRKDPGTWEHGPAEEMRFSTDEVSATLAPYFTTLKVEDVGQSMFAVTAQLD